MQRFRNSARLLRAIARVALRRRRVGPRLPGWPFMFEAAVDFMRDTMVLSMQLPPEAQRRLQDSLSPSASLALAKVRRTPLDQPDFRALWFEPRRKRLEAAPVLMYLHGGGYVFGSNLTHADLIARLSLASGARALSVEYRLAPEHPYPCALEDALAAYRYLLGSGMDPKRIVIAGDSAGGGLTLSTLIALRDHGEPLPAAAVLISPWVRLRSNAASLRDNFAYDWAADFDMIPSWENWYLGDSSADDPLVSPLGVDLTGLPPLLIHVGGAEMLRDDIVEFAARAERAGVNVTSRLFEHMVHNFQVFHSFIPIARQAIDEIGAFVREQTRPRHRQSTEPAASYDLRLDG